MGGTAVIALARCVLTVIAAAALLRAGHLVDAAHALEVAHHLGAVLVRHARRAVELVVQAIPTEILTAR